MKKAGRPLRVLELRSVWGTGGGPEKTILLGAVRGDAARFAVTVCYIRDARDRQFTIDARAAALGVDYVEIVERHSLDWSIVPALRSLIRRRQITIVHAHEHKTALLALLIAALEPVIPLATAHGWSGLSLKERACYAVERRLLARYPQVIAVSEPIRRAILACGADPSRVTRIPNGIDDAAFRRIAGTRERMRAAIGIEPDRVVLGAIGRLEAVKRFDLLVEAAAVSRLGAPPLIVIAGEGPMRSLLVDRARALGIEHDLRLLGHRDDAADVHQAFDVYVQTSDSEGVPNAILEAMALKTPVVATDVGGTSHLIDHGVHGLLVPRGDAPALAAAISETVGSPWRTHERTTAARQRIERDLSFDARVRAVETVYDDLAERYAPPPSGIRALRWA
jgi:glycosyltransferase involved in cell wall biosynthesis